MRIRVYNKDNEHRASLKSLDEAAGFCEYLGEGATIRTSKGVKSTLWTEGEETEADSHSDVAEICRKRYAEKHTLED